MADFDFGNLIYIAMMIAFAILGARKRKKTNKNPYRPSTDPQTESKPGFFDEIFGEQLKNFIPGQEEDISKPVFEHVNEGNYQSEEVDEMKLDIEVPVKKSYSDFIRKEVIISDDISIDNRSEVLKSLGDFDLKKAVIYSEILSRKEY